jgi:hypothetical protein
MKRPFILAGIIGMCVIAISVVLLMVFPGRAIKTPPGFFTPIITFEFIRTPQEVMDMFGPSESPTHQELVRAMDLGNRIDFLYMVLYNAFLFVFCRKVASLMGRKAYLLGSVMAIVILAGDFFENIQLLGITSRLNSGGFEPQLALLRVFTWQKWGGIVVVFLILLPYFLKGSILSRVIAACSALSAVLGVMAFMHHGMANEFFSLSVALVFLLMISYSLLYHKPGRPAEE